YNAKLYVNGVLEPDEDNIGSLFSSNDEIRIGAGWSGGNRLDGAVDDVRFYDRALSEEEIADVYAAVMGPVAHWKLDETSGTIAMDSAGGHDGTTANTEWVTGQVDGGLRFDSSFDSVIVSHSAELSLTDELTLMAWINKNQLSGYDPAITKATSGSDLNFFLGTWENNPVFGFSTSSDNWQGYYATSTSLSTNTWYHLAATFDNANNVINIYVNGTLVQSFTSTLTPRTNSGLVRLGRSAINEYWPGMLDDVRIYDRALDAAEIAAIGGGGGGGGGGGDGAPAFESFADAGRSSNGTSLSVAKPIGTAAGDLLVAAIVTDGNSASSLNLSGWTPVNIGANANGRVSLGIWWKQAGSSEPNQYQFTWSGNEQAYGWIMRFTGHDPSSPILYDAGALTGDSSSDPIAQRLTTTEDDMLVLRVGGFDDDDIVIGNPGLAGHTPITMGESGTGNRSASGGAGYMIQETAGDTDLAWFSLTNNEEFRTVTLGIRPEP
ncbi:MAG: LamG-like jellyroll fold domain-containing protein, partial [Woeseiaceae bacterium]